MTLPALIKLDVASVRSRGRERMKEKYIKRSKNDLIYKYVICVIEDTHKSK